MRRSTVRPAELAEARFASANNRMAFVSHMPKRHVAILSRCKKFLRSGNYKATVRTPHRAG
jgi:hypothetical protein